MLYFIRTIWAVCAFHHQGDVYARRSAKPRSLEAASATVLPENPQTTRHRRKLNSHRSLGKPKHSDSHKNYIIKALPTKVYGMNTAPRLMTHRPRNAKENKKLNVDHYLDLIVCITTFYISFNYYNPNIITD